MCKNTIRIRNKSRRVDEFTTPLYLDVPCGHCKSCEKRKQDDWFVRAVSEYRRCVGKNLRNPKGFVWFPTLTYDNENLPIWDDKRYNYQVPCFDKRHFVSFRTKLRVYLKREGYDLSGENTMRYMYVTEYGGKKGRPHIHALLFIPIKIPFVLFKRLVNKAWIYGMVRYSPSGDIVKSVKALSYTMKYLNKDMAWLTDYKVNEYLNTLYSDYKDAKDVVDKSRKFHIYKEFKKFMPHHCQSMGFGSSFEVSDDMFVNDKISASSLSLFDSDFIFHVPLYYKRKFLYNYDKTTGLYTINERGLEIQRQRFPLLVRDLQRYIESRYDVSYIDDIARMIPDVDLLPDYDAFTSLPSYPSDLVAKYMLSFRNVQIPDTMYHDMLNETDRVEDFVEKQAFSYYVSRLVNKDLMVLDSDFKRPLDVLMFNDVPVLNVIERALAYIQNVDKLVSHYKNEAYLQDLYNSQIQIKFL